MKTRLMRSSTWPSGSVRMLCCSLRPQQRTHTCKRTCPWLLASVLFPQAAAGEPRAAFPSNSVSSLAAKKSRGASQGRAPVLAVAKHDHGVPVAHGQAPARRVVARLAEDKGARVADRHDARLGRPAPVERIGVEPHAAPAGRAHGAQRSLFVAPHARRPRNSASETLLASAFGTACARARAALSGCALPRVDVLRSVSGEWAPWCAAQPRQQNCSMPAWHCQRRRHSGTRFGGGGGCSSLATTTNRRQAAWRRALTFRPGRG